MANNRNSSYSNSNTSNTRGQASTQAVRPIDRMLKIFPDAKPSGNWYNTRCPAHDDHEMSFGFIESATGGVNFHCFAGCSREHILSALNLTEDDIRGKGSQNSTRKDQHITLWELAVNKCIHPNCLSSYGLIDNYTWNPPKGKPVKNVIRIPYYLQNGQAHTLAHVRLNLIAKDGTRADGTGNLIPYGLDRLEDARKAGYLIIVEGESDCWTLWRFGFPALGIPGATNFKTLDARMLNSIDRVYISQEMTDSAGKAFPSNIAKCLAETGYNGQCFALPLMNTHDVKDPNALLQRLYREGRINAFKEELKIALDAAIAVDTHQQADEPTPLIERLHPLVMRAIEQQDTAALYDLTGQIAELDTKERALLTSEIQGAMHRCAGFSWAAFKKLLTEALNAKQKREHEQRIYVSGRPQILLGRQLREEGDDALSALYKANTPPEIYVRSGKLARIRVDEKGAPMIETLTDTMLIERLTRIADFVTYNEQTERYSSAHPTTKIANYILDQKQWLFPPLEGIIEVPSLRTDGTIIDHSGYDAQTRLCYLPPEQMKQCRIPAHPTKEDVERAATFLLSVIEEFPFETQADRANMVAALLTPIVRPAIRSDVQLALLDATKPGTGKGYLAHLIAMIATGKYASPIHLPDTDDELEKRLGAKLLYGSTVVIIDNVSRKLQSSILEQVLTAGGEHGVRILGQSKLVNVNTRASWIATGNNIQLGGDLARRCYRIRLVSPVSNPDERDDFKIEDFFTWIEDHRSDLLVALLTLAHAWYAAGKPKAKNIPNLASFTQWAKTVGGILAYAGIEGFQQNRAELKAEANVEEGQWEGFLLAWDDCFKDNWISVSTLVEKIKATPDLFAGSSNQPPANFLAEFLPDALKISLQEKPNGFNIKLARALDKRVKTPYGEQNIRIEKLPDKHTKVNAWRVKRVAAGSRSNATRNEKTFISPDEEGEKKEEKKYSTAYETARETTSNYPQQELKESIHGVSNGSTSQSVNNGEHAGSFNLAGSSNEQANHQTEQKRKRVAI